MNPPSENTAAPSGNSVSSARKAGFSSWRPVLATVAGFGLLAWLFHVGLHACRFVETDDAYITGHLHQISPQVDGQVKDVLVRDNQLVQAGDPLVRLDPQELDIALQKAAASLDQARAQAQQADAAAVNSEAQLATAQAHATQAEAQVVQTAAQLELARLTYERAERLVGKGGAITEAERDSASAGFHAAEAAHAASQANLNATRSSVASAKAAKDAAIAQIAAAKANIDVAAAAVHDAQRKLAYTAITAPATGRICNRAVESGNRVVAGQTLFSLASADMWVVANFKETQLARMQPGEDVEISIDALPGKIFHGSIDSLAPASGAQFALLPPDNATGNFNKVVQRVPVKILLAPESLRELGDKLRLGLSVIVNVRVR